MISVRHNQQKCARRKKNLFWGISVLGGIYFGTVLFNLVIDNSVNATWTDFNKKQLNHPEKLSISANLLRYKREARIEENTIIPNVTDSNSVFTVSNNASGASEKPQGIYPVDIFDLKARKKGAVVLHTIGMLYMFVALAIVCDEFFVPALEVIIYRLGISDDVAGATFMAAGGSAPELFTSIIGVFLAKSNVGVGTIVGSAVFNILFVIGMCSIFSHGVLVLTWWPLFRDCFFYILSLIVLIYSFTDAKIQFYESIALMLMYLLYVTFMKFNKSVEAFVKSKLSSLKSSSSSGTKVGPSEKKMPQSVRAIVESISSRDDSHPKNTFSYGIVQLIMHSLDPSTDDSTSSDKSSQLYAIARSKLVSPRAARSLSINSNRSTKGRNINCDEMEKINRPTTPTAVIYDNNEGVKVVAETDPSQDDVFVDTSVTSAVTNINSSNGNVISTKTTERRSSKDSSNGMGDALDMSWPKTCSKRCVYIVLFPIMFLLWLTLPDVRIQKKEKWFMASFFGSIFWIGIFSYLMVWWAHQIGETIGLSETVMGLTFIAAGTSVPDLITSVIVARKGLGDMAVSSSVGSNIFDVTIGLPFPWLLKSITTLGNPVVVESEGLFCSVLLLFAMLVFVVVSIAVCRWKMNKKLAVILLILYAVFLVFSLLLELSVIKCTLNAT